MGDVSVDVTRLIEQAFEIAKSGGVKHPAMWRADLAEAWGMATVAHFSRLAESCNPPVVVRPGLMLEFLKSLTPPKEQD